MKKIELNFNEVQSLLFEIRGINNGQFKLTGLINQKLSMSIKFDLNKILLELTNIFESYEKLRNELIQELGVKSADGSVSIPQMVENENGEKIPNKNLEKFMEQIMEFEKKSFEIQVPKLKFASFENLETEDYYGTFFRLIAEK